MSTATKKQELPAGHSRGSAYERYKKTTRAFRDSLQKLVSSKMRIVSISDLAVASELVLEMSRKLSLPKKNKLKDLQSLLTNLDETIVLREAVGAAYFDGMDDGHRYIIQVLKYCRGVLRASRANLQSGQGVNENVSDSHNSRGRYGVLGNDGSDEEEHDDEPSFERPSRTVDNKEYSIEKDLIIGSLAFQANLFLLTAESLFSIVADSYETLKQNMEDLKQSDLGSQEVNHKTAICLMQATAAVNLTLENVRYLEQTFYLESDHLKNVYHVFAVLIFQDKIAELEAIVGKEILAKEPALCLDFAGKCMHFGFTTDGVVNCLSQEFTSLVHDLFKAEKFQPTLSGTQLEKIKEIGIGICATACVEVNSDPEYSSTTVDILKEAGTVAKSIDVSTLQWLKNYKILGGKSGIIHTLARLEKFKLNPCPAHNMKFARSWQSTRQIMDTVFQSGTFPLLSDLYSRGMRNALPGIGFWFECSTCVSFLREFDEMTKCCLMNSFSAAFGAHALAYAMFVLQGDDRCKRLAVLSQLTIGKFVAQVKEANDTDFVSCLETLSRLETYSENPLHVMKDTKVIEWLSYCGQPSLRSLSMWNPLLAGSFLLTATLSSNMIPFYCLFDAHLQTRTVLHLYNALRQREMVGQIELLELLDRVLISDKRIWPNGKPKRSELLTSFGVAAGDSARVVDHFVDYRKESNYCCVKVSGAPEHHPILGCAEDLSAEQAMALNRVSKFFCLRDEYGSSKVVVDINCLECTNGSSACRSLIYNDFPDIQASDNNLMAEFGATCARQAAWLQEKIAKDHELLSLNWLKVGHLLDEFVEQLLDIIEISPLVDMYDKFTRVLQGDFPGPFHEKLVRRDIGNKFLMDMVFFELEFENDVETCVVSKKVASCMVEYFTTVATRQAATFF